MIFINYLYSAQLIFSSSFEESELLTPNRDDSTIWWQEFSKSNLVLKGKNASFQMIVEDDNLHGFMENKIEKTKGREGIETYALHQIIKKKEQEWTQNAYIIDMEDKDQDRLYIRYSLRFPKNLSELLGKDSWLVFSEYKTFTDYRLALYIYSDNAKKLYWYAHGDNVVLDDIPYVEYWYRENRTVPVLQGEWMDIEIFWNRSTGKDGRVWLSVNGNKIIDYKGSTKLIDPINYIMFFTNYAKNPIDQWIDNIEVWDDFPCGTGKSCYKRKKGNK